MLPFMPLLPLSTPSGISSSLQRGWGRGIAGTVGGAGNERLGQGWGQGGEREPFFVSKVSCDRSSDRPGIDAFGALVVHLCADRHWPGGTDSKGAPNMLCLEIFRHFCSYNLPEPSDDERVKLEKKRTDKSMFVQELLLSTLAYLDSSSSSEDGGSDHEQT